MNNEGWGQWFAPQFFISKTFEMNNNIQEDYCSFEVSKLLKEKGFNVYCQSFYRDNTGKLEEYIGNYNRVDQEKDNLHSSRPTHSIAIKWMRENFGIWISIDVLTNGLFIAHIQEYDNTENEWLYMHCIDNSPSPEEVMELALLHTLKNIIHQ